MRFVLDSSNLQKGLRSSTWLRWDSVSSSEWHGYRQNTTCLSIFHGQLVLFISFISIWLNCRYQLPHLSMSILINYKYTFEACKLVLFAIIHTRSEHDNFIGYVVKSGQLLAQTSNSTWIVTYKHFQTSIINIVLVRTAHMRNKSAFSRMGHTQLIHYEMGFKKYLLQMHKHNMAHSKIGIHLSKAKASNKANNDKTWKNQWIARIYRESEYK